MNIKITYGDVVRHMDDYEMAEFFLLERIKIVHQVLDSQRRRWVCIPCL